MAGSTELTGIDVFHGYLVSTLFHLEDLRMAVSAFLAGISMYFAGEGNLAHRTFSKHNRLPGGNRQGSANKGKCKSQNDR